MITLLNGGFDSHKSFCNKFDLIVTSPPYNIGIKYPNYDDNLANNDYILFIETFTEWAKKSLKDDGSLFFNFGNILNDPERAYKVCGILSSEFKLQNVIIWIKSFDGNGHFKPINSDRYLNNGFEYIYHFTKTGDVKLDKLAIGIPYKDKSNIKRWNKLNDLRDNGNVWYIPYETKNKSGYPSTFPVELPYRCIKLHGIKNQMVVCDSFHGSGTTEMACKLIEEEANIKINYIGIDL